MLALGGGKPLRQVMGCDSADVVDGGKLILCGGGQGTKEPNVSAKIFPAFCPTCRMPKANSKRDRSLLLDRSMAASRFSARFSPHPVQLGHLLCVQMIQVTGGSDHSRIHQGFDHRRGPTPQYPWHPG